MNNQIDFSVLLQAPLFSALAIILGFGLAWLIVHYTYKDRLKSLQERIQRREEKIAELEGKVN